jgi:hypothetical protein
MTASELSQYVGREGTWEVPKVGVKIKVKILDARSSYGRFELKISPVAGSGETWAQNVVMDPKKKK